MSAESRKEANKAYRQTEAGKALTLKVNRRWMWKQKGLDPELVEQALLENDGTCDACGDALLPGPGTHVDHDHAVEYAGRPRGILCPNCNIALGHTKDSPDRLHKLIAYLERTAR